MKVVRKVKIKKVRSAPPPAPKRSLRINMDSMPVMTSKIKAVIASSGTAFFGFVSWLATVPPETQSGILGSLVEALPLQWRPAIGLWTRFFMVATGVYASYQAAHSGPQTPPANSPKE